MPHRLHAFGLSFAVFILLSLLCAGQDTFSIVAVDTETGEVGSAGATCLDSLIEGTSAIIISDVLPGLGVIHTQSFWNPVNQANARIRMEAGDSPAEILTWLEANDADGDPGVRQYGIADFNPSGGARVASFTGADCFTWRGDIQGTDFAVQGNILIGPEVLDSMAWYFHFTEGDLADRLMAALRGAKIPGADSRCLSEGVSSRSAFIRVAKPDDSTAFYLDLVVGVTPFGLDPIDVLQDKFDDWRADNPPPPPSGLSATTLGELRVFPNPVDPQTRIEWLGGAQSVATNQLQVLSLNDASGKLLAQIRWDGLPIPLNHLYNGKLPSGLYVLSLHPDEAQQEQGVQTRLIVR